MPLASPGLRSNQSRSRSLVTFCTNDLASVLPSLVLVWPSNCGSASLTDTIAVRPSRTSSPVRFGSFSLRNFWSRAYLLTIEVSAVRKPFLVGAALGRVDHVRERVHRLVVRAVPLHRDLGRHVQLVVLVTELDDLSVHRFLGRVQVADEVGDAARVLVDHRAGLGGDRGGGDRRRELLVRGLLGDDLGRPLVGQRDAQPSVEERGLLQPPGQGLERPLKGLEDPVVWPERGGRPGLRSVASPRCTEPSGAPRS